MLKFSSALSSALVSVSSKQAWCNAVIAALGSTRRVICKRSDSAGDVWGTGTTFLDITLTGSMAVVDYQIHNLGVMTTITTQTASNLATGFAVLRIEGATSATWVEGTIGLPGSGADFILRANLTALGMGVGFSAATIIKAPPRLPDVFSGGLLTTFSLDNWDSVSSTRTLFRGGMPFKKGDIPAGSVPQIRRASDGSVVAAQFDERATWSDGSLRFCVCHLRDTNIAASGSQAYEIYSVAGSFNNTGTKTLASIVAADALTVELSAFKFWAGPTASPAAGAASGSKVVFISDSVSSDASATVRLNVSGGATGRIEYSTDAGATWTPWAAGTVSATTTEVVTSARLIRAFCVTRPTSSSVAAEVLPQARKSGAALLSVPTISTVGTRVTKIHSGPVCETYQIWGMFRDGAAGAGAEDAHMKGIAYMSVWKDGADAVIDTEFGVEHAQDWWGVADKYRLDYTATLKRNGTTVQAYTGVQHPYHAHWMTVQMQDDNNNAKRHWVGATPRLVYRFSKSYWVRTRVVPPFNTTATPEANGSIVYSPLSAQQHRPELDSTGTYMGRGVLPNCDAKTFMRQTALDFRNSRVNAFAGLHIPYHFRDERTRTRPSESADVANTIIPLLWLPKSSAASTFAGLPTPKHAYRGVSTSTPNKGGYVDLAGGTGVWALSENTSHAVPYSSFGYIVEGERHFLESVYDLAAAATQQPNGNEFASMPTFTGQNYSAIPGFLSQERSLGWGANLVGFASALAPTDDVQGQYMRAWNSHAGDFLDAFLAVQSPTHAGAGKQISGMSAAGTVYSPWQSAIVIMGCCQNFLSTEVAGFKNHATMSARATAALAARGLYELAAYRASFSPINSPDSVVPFPPASGYMTGPFSSGVISGNTANTGEVLPASVANGDELYFFGSDPDGTTAATPAGYTPGTKLYAVNQSGSSFQLSLTLGGSPTTLVNGAWWMVGKLSGRSGINPAVNPPYLPPADSYIPMNLAAFALAESAGLSTVPAGLTDTVAAFLVNADLSSWPAWNLRSVA